MKSSRSTSTITARCWILDDELTTEDAQRLNLQTLRERIEMLQGSFHMSSTPGHGVQVNFELPIGKEE